MEQMTQEPKSEVKNIEFLKRARKNCFVSWLLESESDLFKGGKTYPKLHIIESYLTKLHSWFIHNNIVIFWKN